MTEREKTCEERIDAAWVRQSASDRACFKAIDGTSLTREELSEVTNLAEPDVDLYDHDDNTYDGDDLVEMAHERMEGGNYGFSVYKVFRYVWSGGGPSSQLEVDVDEDGDVVGARFRFQDWFDGAVRELEGDDLEFAERYHEANAGGFY